jgi:DNA-binding NarL/FixJ family response regulator
MSSAPTEQVDGQDAPRERPVTVAVVDDNSLIRMGLRSLLEADPRVHVVGEAGDGEAAVQLVRQTLPDVVLLDVRMPRRDGVSALAEIRDHSKVVMLTYSDAPDVIRAALEAGATGYLVHGQFRPEDLVSSVLGAAVGSSVMSAPALDALREALTQQAPQQAAPQRPDAGLSEREVEVMDLIGRGLTNGQIARECYLSEKTVKNHVNHIFAKLGVRTRAEAVSLWLGGTS